MLTHSTYCELTVSICELPRLYGSIIPAKPLHIINSFKESSAIIHFTLLLLALHGSQGIMEQLNHFIYRGQICTYTPNVFAHTHTRPAHTRK